MTAVAPSYRSPFGYERPNDPALYPVVQYQEFADQEPGFWRSLRETLAERLIAPRWAEQDEHDTADLGVRYYQQELARRAHAALRQRTREGWWLGPAPYGYALHYHRLHECTGRPARRQHLVIDEERAPVVGHIFRWYLAGTTSETTIAARLIAEQHPPPLDPVSGQPRTWTPNIVHTVLHNPAYLGYVVRGRTLHGHPRSPECWTWSQTPAHPALVEPRAFWAVYNSRFRSVQPDPPAVLEGQRDAREAA